MTAKVIKLQLASSKAGSIRFQDLATLPIVVFAIPRIARKIFAERNTYPQHHAAEHNKEVSCQPQSQKNFAFKIENIHP